MRSHEPPFLTEAAGSNGVPASAPTRFALIGAGWRSRAYLDVARLRPDLFEVTAVLARRPEVVRERLGIEVEVTDSLERLLSSHPDVVVVSVPWAATPELVRELVSRGVHVLAETPPAPDDEGLRALWRDVGESALVQVAEQYLRMPVNAAAREIVARGTIGTPSFVHVSSTHEYHAVAMIRGLLDSGLAPVTVRTHVRSSPLVDPLTPDGWTRSDRPVAVTTTLATIDVDGGGTGLYEFTDNQWWNPLRPDHLTVQGSHGELHDDVVVRMGDATTVLSSRIERRFTGRGMNFEGADSTTVTLDDQVVYRNPFEGGRLSDDEIAVAAVLADAGAWARGDGPGPYSLAEACYDHAIALAIRRAVNGPEQVDGGFWTLRGTEREAGA